MVPHYNFIAFAQLLVLRTAYNAVWGPEQIAVQKSIGAVYIFDVFSGAGVQSLQVVERMVAYAVSALDNHTIFFGEFVHIVPHHKKGGLDVILIQNA